MTWQISFFNESNKGNYIDCVEWAEEHKFDTQQIRITKRKWGMEATNNGKRYKIMLLSKMVREVGTKIVAKFPSIEILDCAERYCTDSLSDTMDFIDEIKQEIEKLVLETTS